MWQGFSIQAIFKCVKVDKEEDQTFVDEMVWLKVKVLYEHGWSIGEVLYYNKALIEYKISYSDGADDFIPEDEMGSAEVQLLMWKIFLEKSFVILYIFVCVIRWF